VGQLITGKTVLHVGCGSDSLPEWFKDCNETRLDIVDTFKPDIVANMMSMGDIGKYDIVLARHSLEHLAPHEVGKALKEFIRVLNDGGLAIVFVPDLEDVKPTEDILFESPAGPITGLDLMYGFRKVLEESPFMAHKTGFTKELIEKEFDQAGFNKIKANRLANYDLICAGVK